MLIGRDAELQALRAVIDRARAGSGGAIVVHGEAGVGKSALLDAVQGTSDDMRVLRTSGIESESPLAFAALHRLLIPLLDRLDRLPPPQAQAVAAVLGYRSGPSGDDRFLVFLAALGLLSDAAEESPVLCLVDDAHWLDEASRAALLFIARRIEVSSIAVVFAARDGDTRRFEATDLADLPLGGLGADAADLLLRAEDLGRQLAPSVRQELVDRIGGNPLALVEIARALSAPEAHGVVPLPRELPMTRDLERVFTGQVERLSEDAAAFLLLAALDDTGEPGVLRQAAASFRVDADAAMVAAERAGLITITPDGVAYRHPLMRSAVVAAATVSERRRAHLALADTLDVIADSDRAVWHRAAAADAPDETIASRLDEIAGRSRRIGGHEAWGAAAVRAAELSPTADARAARLASAAAAAWAVGDPGRARSLAERVIATSDAPGVIAEAGRLLAFIEMNFGSPRSAHRLLVDGSRTAMEAGDFATARRLGMVACAVATFGEGSGAEVDVATLAVVASGADPADACLSALLTGMDHVAHDRWRPGVADLRRALELGESITLSTDLVTNLGIAAVHLGDDRAALRWHDRQLDEARESAMVLQVIHALTRRGFAQLSAGEWGELRGAMAEVVDLARAIGQPNQEPLALAEELVLDAFMTEGAIDDRANEIETRLRQHPTGVVDRSTLDLIAWASGVRAARSAPEVAMAHLTSIALPPFRRAAAVDLLEVAARLERTDILEATVRDLEEFAAATGEAWARGDAAYGRALLSQPDRREPSFVEALGHHAEGTRPLDRARTELAYGEFLRRSRRRVDAREHLRAAIAAFDRLGAVAWSERAADELRASGETARRRTGDDEPSGLAALTPQELQVARLVKSGLSNREVAARLFVSPRTVEFHLRNVFVKLGISSRGALAATDLAPVG